MQKRRLGQTDIYLSVIGLGTVKFGRNMGVKYPNAFQLPTDAELITLIEAAQALGVNYLDTAPAYGHSETRLGHLLKGQRDRWIIGTKVGESFEQGVSLFDFSETATIKSVERSLQRLNTDYLDIVLVHSDGNDEQIIKKEPVLKALMSLKACGKIRAFGVSTKTIAGGMLALDHTDLVMVTYNLQEQGEKEVIDYAKTHQKGVLVKKALASGHIKDPQSALKFVLQTPGITSVVLGTINPTHLHKNIETACLSIFSQ